MDEIGWVFDRVSLEVAQSKIFLEGLLTVDPTRAGSWVEARASGRNFQNVMSPWTNYHVPNVPYKGTVKLNVVLDGIELKELNLKLGDHQVIANILFPRGPDVGRSNGRIHIDGPSTIELATLFGFEPGEVDRPYDFSFAVNARLTSGTVLVPVFYSTSPAEKANSNHKSEFYSREPVSLDWLEYFDLALEDGQLSTRDISWEGNSNHGRANVNLMASLTGTEVQIDVTSKRVPLLWFLFGDFLHGISGGIFGSSNKGINVQCSAGAMIFKDGIARLAPAFVSRTDKIDMFVTGSNDNKSEKPSLMISTRSRTGIGVSAASTFGSRTRVSGTLTNPKFSVDPAGTAISGSAAYLTGGLSILASGRYSLSCQRSCRCTRRHDGTKPFEKNNRLCAIGMATKE